MIPILTKLRDWIRGSPEEYYRRTWLLQAVLLAGVLKPGESVMVERRPDEGANFKHYLPPNTLDEDIPFILK